MRSLFTVHDLKIKRVKFHPNYTALDHIREERCIDSNFWTTCRPLNPRPDPTQPTFIQLELEERTGYLREVKSVTIYSPQVPEANPTPKTANEVTKFNWNQIGIILAFI